MFECKPYIKAILFSVLTFLVAPTSTFGSDDYSVRRCKIVELLRRGQIESNRYIIRAYSRRGKVIQTFKAMDGRPFDGRSEAELGLFLLVEEGSCPE